MDRPFHPDFILKAFPLLLKYLPVTLGVMGATVLASGVLGLLLARARLGENKIAAKIAEFYVTVMRCTPSIVLLFIMYYAVPRIVLGLFKINLNNLDKAVFVICSLSLLFAATMCELMRSAYSAVDCGQKEAALSIGLSETEAFVRIILPQATAIALPNFCNALIALSKEGALAYTIGLIDMMGQGNLIIARNYGSYTIETYITLAVIYWVLTIIIEQSFLAIERHLSKGKRIIENTQWN
ncbi:MAG: amino acid ABC transporter permease [Spirochaetaceae bacterium]|jgi:L-cystine transport system permease protein|nr:amino acid ABC transporter permease [Spirochaetaceae bacterium]